MFKIVIIISILTLSFSWGGRGSNRHEKGPEKDLYKILEITKRASKDEIKKAYKKLTRKYHPDKNPDNKDKFVEITEAYEILSNSNKRRIYDTKGYQAAIDSSNNNDDNNDMDIFSSIFGGGRMRKENKNEDQRIKLKVTLNDLYNGKEYNYKYTRNIICPHCRGTGANSEDDIKVCTKCGGQGIIMERQQIAPGYIQQFQRQCPKCNGQGKTISKSCNVCNKNKIILSIEEMSVFVEKGMSDGQEITFEDAADESPDKSPGNLVFVVSEGKHPVFKRESNNLHTNITITLKQALLGFDKTLRHLDGRDVEVTREEVTQPGYVIKMKGEGMPIHEKSGEFGDLFITVNVEFPKVLSEEQIKLANQLFSRRAYW